MTETLQTCAVIVGMISAFVVMFDANRRFKRWLRDNVETTPDERKAPPAPFIR